MNTTEYRVLNVGTTSDLEIWLNEGGKQGFVIEQILTLGGAMLIIMSRRDNQ